MVWQATTETFLQPTSVEAALAYLHDLGPAAMPLAGATWAMRAPLRHEDWPRVLVSLNRIAALHALDTSSSCLGIGALVTHERLAQALKEAPDLRGLCMAAGMSANPSVRRLATVGGNLCIPGFPAADLIPALLAADASVQLATALGTEELSLEAFLTRRVAETKPWLLTGLTVTRDNRYSAHERLTMRKAGDYPCAIVGLSVAINARGRIDNARIGIGAVELVGRRWRTLEQALSGQEPVPAEIEKIAAGLTKEFCARDAHDIPAWYRLSVLPVLVRRAFETIQSQIGAR